MSESHKLKYINWEFQCSLFCMEILLKLHLEMYFSFLMNILAHLKSFSDLCHERCTELIKILDYFDNNWQ